MNIWTQYINVLYYRRNSNNITQQFHTTSFKYFPDNNMHFFLTISEKLFQMWFCKLIKLFSEWLCQICSPEGWRMYHKNIQADIFFSLDSVSIWLPFVVPIFVCWNFCFLVHLLLDSCASKIVNSLSSNGSFFNCC